MMSIRERYLHDVVFHTIVDTMVQAIDRACYTPTEIREAAMMAQILYEERYPRLVIRSPHPADFKLPLPSTADDDARARQRQQVLDNNARGDTP